MKPLSAPSAAALEAARQVSGQFGTQDHAESGEIPVAPEYDRIRFSLESVPTQPFPALSYGATWNGWETPVRDRRPRRGRGHVGPSTKAMIAAYREPDRAKGRHLMTRLIDSISHDVPAALEVGKASAMNTALWSPKASTPGVVASTAGIARRRGLTP